MDQIPQDGKHRHWPRKQVSIAFGLIPLGLFSWIGGIAVGLSGENAVAFFALEGLAITAVGGGIIWIIVLLIRLFVLRRRSRRS